MRNRLKRLEKVYQRQVSKTRQFRSWPSRGSNVNELSTALEKVQGNKGRPKSERERAKLRDMIAKRRRTVSFREARHEASSAITISRWYRCAYTLHGNRIYLFATMFRFYRKSLQIGPTTAPGEELTCALFPRLSAFFAVAGYRERRKITEDDLQVTLPQYRRVWGVPRDRRGGRRFAGRELRFCNRNLHFWNLTPTIHLDTTATIRSRADIYLIPYYRFL